MNYQFLQNKQKGFIGIAIVVVIALILGGGGVYYYQKNKEVKEEVKTEENVSQDNTGNINTSNSETADWKTYENDKYGFEFTYPKELWVDLTLYEDREVNNLQPTILLIGPSLDDERIVKIFFSILDNTKKMDLVKPDWINKKTNFTDIWIQGLEENLEGYESYAYIRSIDQSQRLVSASFGITVLSKENNYKKDASGKSLAEEQYRIYNQILSTFKFTK